MKTKREINLHTELLNHYISKFRKNEQLLKQKENELKALESLLSETKDDSFNLSKLEIFKKS